MKIGISSEGKDVSSLVSDAAGRAPYYLIFENENLVKTIKNPFSVGGGGAGFAVAQMLANEDVNLVVAGKFGNNMTNSIKEKGMNYKEISGVKVEEALKQVLL